MLFFIFVFLSCHHWFCRYSLTTVFGGTSFVTTLPAATTEFSWTVTFGSIVTHPPMTTLSLFMEGLGICCGGYLSFSRLVFGPMKTLSPTWHSFDIVTWAWIMQFLPIITFFLCRRSFLCGFHRLSVCCRL